MPAVWQSGRFKDRVPTMETEIEVVVSSRERFHVRVAATDWDTGPREFAGGAAVNDGRRR